VTILSHSQAKRLNKKLSLLPSESSFIASCEYEHHTFPFFTLSQKISISIINNISIFLLFVKNIYKKVTWQPVFELGYAIVVWLYWD